MQQRPLKHLGGLLATTAFALILIGCNGKNGDTGPAGANGINGANGTNGANAILTVNAAQLTPGQWAALKPVGTITGVTIGSAPVVTFKLTDAAGTPIVGLGGFTSKSIVPDRSGNLATLAGYPNLAFALAKLVPEDAATKAPSKWVSYIVTSVPVIKASTGAAVPAGPTTPTTDNTGTLVDNGDGTYRYTFYRDITKAQAALDAATYTVPSVKADLGDVTYAPTQVHRLTLQFSGNARGTGSNTPDGVTVATAVPMDNPINVIYDFVPSTGAPVAAGTDIRDVVSINRCNECHDKLAFHGGGRVEARYCVVCHTDQRKFGRPEATTTATGYSGFTYKVNGKAAGDFPTMVHQIHMGKELAKTGYNYANVLYNNIGYSILDGGQKLCAKCHTGVAQAANWSTKPTRLACGSCHDRVDFATGAKHMPGILVPQPDDTACTICHTSDVVKAAHMSNNVTPNNPTIAADLKNVTYEIKSAAATATTVIVVFKVKVDGASATFLAPATGMANPLAGFTGSPSFLLAYAQPQDGVAAPVDYNNLGSGSSNFQPISVSIANLLDPNYAATRGTLSGPDSSGYYTATLVGTKIFPAGAMLRSVSLQGYFTQVFTTDRNGDGVVNSSDNVARHAISVIKTVTGDTARRNVVDSAKCAKCHEWFEGHGGNRVYEVQVCVQCHVPGLATSGRGIADATLVAYPFTTADQAILTAWRFDKTLPNAALALPQVTNNFKDMIHGLHAGKDRATSIKIARDRTPSAINLIDGAKIGFPGILHDCQSCHTPTGYSGTPANALASRQEADNGVFLNGTNRTPADAKAALATINANDLMTTPLTAACVSCHDSTIAKAHMKQNGGQVLVPRSALDMAGETCAVCHGAGTQFDPVKMHQ
ncbi:MAG TPA: OmcA/MtrC family decaheme c-type cytochrome [Geothrix sp.]